MVTIRIIWIYVIGPGYYDCAIQFIKTFELINADEIKPTKIGQPYNVLIYKTRAHRDLQL